jgi:hypothetical protein
MSKSSPTRKVNKWEAEDEVAQRGYCCYLIPEGFLSRVPVDSQGEVMPLDTLFNFKLRDIKDYIAGQSRHVPRDEPARSSILISCTAVPDIRKADMLEDFKEAAPKDVPVNPLTQNDPTFDPANPDKYERILMTNYQGCRLMDLDAPVMQLGRGLKEIASRHLWWIVWQLSRSLLLVCRSSQEENPGMAARIPICEFRVRDIVVLRYLNKALKDAGMDDVGLRTDTLLGFEDRREQMSEPVNAFCASCLKLSFNHNRCNSCKVSLLKDRHACHLLKTSLPGRLLLLG